MQTDEELVLQIKKGNTALYKEILDRYQKKLERYVRYLTNESIYSEDIVQETFIKVYMNLNSFDDTAKFSSWIYRIAHNEAINKIIKFKLNNLALQLNVFEDVFKDTVNIEQDFERSETSGHVRDTLQQLPLKYKEPLLLYYMEDKSYEEISDIMKLSIGTVGTLINRGKKRMKVLLEKSMEKTK